MLKEKVIGEGVARRKNHAAVTQALLCKSPSSGLVEASKPYHYHLELLVKKPRLQKSP